MKAHTSKRQGDQVGVWAVAQDSFVGWLVVCHLLWSSVVHCLLVVCCCHPSFVFIGCSSSSIIIGCGCLHVMVHRNGCGCCPLWSHHGGPASWLSYRSCTWDINVVTCLIYHVSQTIVSRKEGSMYEVPWQELQNSLEVVHVSFDQLLNIQLLLNISPKDWVLKNLALDCWAREAGDSAEGAKDRDIAWGYQLYPPRQDNHSPVKQTNLANPIPQILCQAQLQKALHSLLIVHLP